MGIVMKRFSVAAFIMLAVVSFSWGEKVHLEAYATNPDSIAIGVLPFTAQSEQIVKTNEPWKIIADDLDFSGKFSVSARPKRRQRGFRAKKHADIHNRLLFAARVAYRNHR